MADAEDVAKVRAYVRQMGAPCLTDGVSDEAIALLVDEARARLRHSGRRRGWLGEVHGALKRRDRI